MTNCPGRIAAATSGQSRRTRNVRSASRTCSATRAVRWSMEVISARASGRREPAVLLPDDRTAGSRRPLARLLRGGLLAGPGDLLRGGLHPLAQLGQFRLADPP